jgi:hypothetical protein
MNRSLLLLIAVGFLAGAGAGAQQPYAGMQTRSIKALSEQQIDDLAAGRGMSLALAAELNGYPGPVHVLELADRLGLSDQQAASVRRLFEAMTAEARPLGENLIAQEAELDRRFADHSVTMDSLQVSTAAIGATQALLRNTHLKFHLLTADLLSPSQIVRYAELRGYTGAGQHDHGMHHR